MTSLGSYLIFCAKIFKFMAKPRVDTKLLFQHMEFVGVRSFWIIVLASIMVGAVFGIQFGQIFRLFSIPRRRRTGTVPSSPPTKSFCRLGGARGARRRN